MPELFEKISQHGAGMVALFCFLEAIGLPLPAAIALLGGGAYIANGKLTLHGVLGGVLAAFLVADLLMYALGRYTGWWLLGLICRLSANPEGCVVEAAETFYRRGRVVLLFAKFVPGLNTMAPPLSGSMRMPLREFVGLDLAGILLYSGAYLTAGYAFSGMLSVVVDVMLKLGRAAEFLVGGALIGFLAYRIYGAWKSRSVDPVPRVEVADLASKLGHDNTMVVDVRSHGYYDTGSERIKGSVRLEPNRLPDAMADLPSDKKIFLYCT